MRDIAQRHTEGFIATNICIESPVRLFRIDPPHIAAIF